MSIVPDVLRARQVSTPILAVTTADQLACVATLTEAIDADYPVISYDVTRGFVGVNERGIMAVSRVCPQEMNDLAAQDPAFAMKCAANLDPFGVLFFYNAHCWVCDPRVAQGIALLRNIYKENTRAIILLGPMMNLPPQLANDVMVFDEPLPDEETLKKVLHQIYDDARACYQDEEEGLALLPNPDPDTEKRAIDAARGLHAAAAENAFAWSMDITTGVQVPRVWQIKKSQIENCKGISFHDGSETFDDIGGLDNYKEFMTRLYNGPEPFTAIVWIDEIEKMMAGGSSEFVGDGGVNKDQLGTILNQMTQNNWCGKIAVGPPGVAKSLAACAAGNTFGVPTICMDLGAMRGGIVGESEANIRHSMKVIKSIAGSGAYFIATCNGLAELKPELQRRYNFGLWYFDLPTDEEKPAIWALNHKRFKIGPEQAEAPDDTDWSGANIRDCCMIAYRLQISLAEAGRFIVPFAQREPEKLKALRMQATGNFQSASQRGVYNYQPTAAPVNPGRKLHLR